MENQDSMYNTINITGKSLIELLQLFFCNIEDDDDYYDVVSYNIAKNYPGHLEYLLNNLSGNRLRGAICGLGLANSNIKHIAAYLNHEDERVICAAIDAARRLDPIDSWEKVKCFLSHDSPYVRGAAIRFARAALNINALPFLIHALDDSHEIVRENALDELDGIADKTLKPRIELLLTDHSFAVQKAARALLESIEAG